MKTEIKHNLAIFALIAMILCIESLMGKNPPSRVSDNKPHVMTIANQTKQLFFLSKQDQNPLISLVHLCKASAKLDCLTTLVPYSTIRELYNVDIDKMRAGIHDLQKEIVQELKITCPKIPMSDGLLW